MTPEILLRLAPPLILLQLLAFGWKVNREINVADAGRQTVIPLPDVINIVSLFATVGCGVVLPLATESYLWLARMVLGAAYVLIAFHPWTVAAHYRLWRRNGASRKATDQPGGRYANHEELATSILSVVLAAVVAACIGRT